MASRVKSQGSYGQASSPNQKLRIAMYVVSIFSLFHHKIFFLQKMEASTTYQKALYVIPGQVLSLSSEAGGSDSSGFLRGHGTYVESLLLDGPSTRQTSLFKDDRTSSNDKVIIMENDMNSIQSEEGDNDDVDMTTDDMIHQPPASSSDKNSRLVASVAGPVTRINKLLSVHPGHSLHYFQGQVGDLVIGRITSIVPVQNRWKVSLVGGVGGGSGLGDEGYTTAHTHKKEAVLPLSGVNLPTGAQRIRTAQDALEMRSFLKEGDLISAEIQKVSYGSSMSATATNAAGVVGMIGGGSGSETIMLHTRSMKYGKLENGCCVHVPPGLIPRRKAHFICLGASSGTTTEDVSMNGAYEDDGFNGIQIDILLGCNGVIWIQRALPAVATGLIGIGSQEDKTIPLAETWELVKKRHSQTMLLPEERVVVARVRNAIEALALVSCNITSESIQQVVKSSVSFKVPEMLKPSVILEITACTRRE